MFLPVTSIAPGHYLNQSVISLWKTVGREKKRKWQYLLYRGAYPAYRDLLMIYKGGGSSSYSPEAQLWFTLGIFTYNWGSFHLACQKARQRRESPRGSDHFPYFLAPDKGTQAGSMLKMMYFWSKSLQLSAARASTATWLLLDRFVPLIRAASDWRRCLCKGKDGWAKIFAVLRGEPALSWGKEFGFRSGWLTASCFRMISVIITTKEITLQWSV